MCGGGGGLGGGGMGGGYMYPSGLDATTVVTKCSDLSVTPGFGLSILNTMVNPATSLSDFYCAAPSSMGCLPPAATLSGFVYGPDPMGAPDGTTFCHYSVQTVACSTLLGGVSSVSDSLLQSAAGVVKNYGSMGDVQCYASSCPTLAGGATFTSSSYADSSTGQTICQYSYPYPNCQYEMGTVTQANILDSTHYSGYDGLEKLFACNITSMGSPLALASPLVAAGFSGPSSWGYPNGTRRVLVMGGSDCSDLGISGSINSSNYSTLPPLGSSFNYGCDIPVANTCPSVDATSLPTVTAGPAFTALGYNRCSYSQPLVSCGATLDSSSWSSLQVSKLANNSGRAYGCETASTATTCPYPSPGLPSDFPTNPASFTVGAKNRCIYSTNVPICSDMTPDGIIRNIWELSQNQGVFQCDLSPGLSACPTLDTPLTSQYISTGSAVSVAATNFNRCYYHANLPACPASPITDPSFANAMAPYSGGGGTGMQVACETAVSMGCPSLDSAAFGHSVSTPASVYEQPLNRTICIYEKVTSIQPVGITNSAPTGSINNNPYWVYWNQPAGADVFDIGTASVPNCADFTAIQTNLASSPASVAFTSNVAKYLCVLAKSNFGLGSIMSPGFPVTVGITPGPITSSSTLIYPPTMTNGTTPTVTLVSKDIYGMPLTTGGATVTFTSSNGTVATIGAATDQNDGTYTATVTTHTTGTFTITAGVAAGTSFSISSGAITVN